MDPDIIIAIETPQKFKCEKCNFVGYHKRSTLYGRIFFHIIKKGKEKDTLKLSANSDNEHHAERIITDLKWHGWVVVDKELVTIEKCPGPVTVYTIEKLTFLKELRRGLE